MGTLHVVATPIGNLDDLSPRASEVLRSVSMVAAEDTRVTRKLLELVGSRAKLVSYHKYTKPSKTNRIIDELENGNVALVTDAGTPSVSDPGSDLVARARASGIRVEAVPGPSAVSAALAVSGIAADRYLFLGFLPRRRSDRVKTLEEAADEPGTLVAFETPHRLQASLRDIYTVMGHRKISLCRELTKMHEETFHGTAEEALEKFSQPQGEFTLVIEGNNCSIDETSDSEILALLIRLREEGFTGRRLVDRAIEYSSARRRQIYRLSTQLDKQRD